MTILCRVLQIAYAFVVFFPGLSKILLTCQRVFLGIFQVAFTLLCTGFLELLPGFFPLSLGCVEVLHALATVLPGVFQVLPAIAAVSTCLPQVFPAFSDVAVTFLNQLLAGVIVLRR